MLEDDATLLNFVPKTIWEMNEIVFGAIDFDIVVFGEAKNKITKSGNDILSATHVSSVV